MSKFGFEWNEQEKAWSARVGFEIERCLQRTSLAYLLTLFSPFW